MASTRHSWQPPLLGVAKANSPARGALISPARREHLPPPTAERDSCRPICRMSNRSFAPAITKSHNAPLGSESGGDTPEGLELPSRSVLSNSLRAPAGCSASPQAQRARQPPSPSNCRIPRLVCGRACGRARGSTARPSRSRAGPERTTDQKLRLRLNGASRGRVRNRHGSDSSGASRRSSTAFAPSG
jgi:hypothetical protein